MTEVVGLRKPVRDSMAAVSDGYQEPFAQDEAEPAFAEEAEEGFQRSPEPDLEEELAGAVGDLDIPNIEVDETEVPDTVIAAQEEEEEPSEELFDEEEEEEEEEDQRNSPQSGPKNDAGIDSLISSGCCGTRANQSGDEVKSLISQTAAAGLDHQTKDRCRESALPQLRVR